MIEIPMKCEDCGAPWKPDITATAPSGGPSCFKCGSHRLKGEVTIIATPLTDEARDFTREVNDGGWPAKPTDRRSEAQEGER